MKRCEGILQPVSAMDRLTKTGLRILIVDDNSDAAEMLSLLLAEVGHSAIFCTNGRDAVDTALGFLPDIVLLDIGMPVMNGYEVATLLRQHHALEGSKIVALSAWGDHETVSKSKASGFHSHLVKPVGLGRLLDEFAKMHVGVAHS
jgi:CheY-like chemotaxis protein